MQEYKGIPIVRNPRRKTLGLYISLGGQPEVRCPYRCPDEKIMEFIDSHADWVASHTAKNAAPAATMTVPELNMLGQEALKEIAPRVRYYAELMQIKVRRVTFKLMKSRWGSCSADGNISLNILLMLAPVKVRDAIVVHELSHRVHMNHSRDFYALCVKYFPEYWECEKWLKSHGKEVLARAYD